MSSDIELRSVFRVVVVFAFTEDFGVLSSGTSILLRL